MADVYEASEEDDCQRRAVIFYEFSHVAVEESGFPDDAAEPGDAEDEEGDHDLQIGGGGTGETPLARKYLNAFLEVDEGDVEAEGIAAEAGDVGEGIAGVGDGEDPVHNQGPDADPSHEGEEVVLRHDDVVDGVREDGDGSGDADDDERLGGEEGEDDAGHDGREEHFVDAVGIVRFGEHVERKGEGGQDAKGERLVLSSAWCRRWVIECK